MVRFMEGSSRKYSAFCAALFLPLGFAQCPGGLRPATNVVAASGYTVRLLASGLSSPRSLIFDNAGNLLVAEQSSGITALTLTDNGGACLEVASRTDVVSDSQLNHGLTLSPDGATLYASTQDVAYAYTYDPQSRSVRGNPQTVVRGMRNPGPHSTRTLRYVNDGWLVVSRGSYGNLDLECGSVDTGHCQVKAFNLNSVPSNGYDFTTQGTRLGWGLRNSVGVDQHPQTGEIWTVENSIDDLVRDSQDIHQDNPGEELNSHGTIGSAAGGNYGYPYCAAAWSTQDIPNNEHIQVGTQFALDVEGKRDDTYCAAQISPRLTFAAHAAPLDIKFNGTNEAFISFHGSWYGFFHLHQT
jgi:glucose/arabinose dehydrogenase